MLEAQPRGKSRELLVLTPRRANSFPNSVTRLFKAAGSRHSAFAATSNEMLLLDSRNGSCSACMRRGWRPGRVLVGRVNQGMRGEDFAPKRGSSRPKIRASRSLRRRGRR